MPEPKSFSLNWNQVAQVGIIALLGWCLMTAHDVEVTANEVKVVVDRIDEAVKTWHQPTTMQTGMVYSTPLDPQPAPDGIDLVYTVASDSVITFDAEQSIWLASDYRMPCDQALDFAQKSMIRAYGQIDRQENSGAVKKTLLSGLEYMGLQCQSIKGGLSCN